MIDVGEDVLTGRYKMDGQGISAFAACVEPKGVSKDQPKWASLRTGRTLFVLQGNFYSGRPVLRIPNELVCCSGRSE
jgi:hypothetical protein